MSYLLSLALLSLFTPFKIATGLVQLRPFDALTGLALVWAFSRGRIFPREGLPLGFVILLPYLAWHVLSALSVGVPNGIREGLQVAIGGGIRVGAQHRDRRARFRAHRPPAPVRHGDHHGLVDRMAHRERLLDGVEATARSQGDVHLSPSRPRVHAHRARNTRRGVLWLGWVCLGAVILASGERKALIVYAALSAALIARGRLLSSLHVIGGAFAVLVLLSGIIEDPYLSRQIESVVDPLDTGDFSTAIATGEAAQGDTRSNAQRGFALALAGDLISQNLLFGVGTNEYERIIESRYAYLPEFLRAGIHGEFLRVLTENGLIGLVSYLAIWLMAVYRTRAVLRSQIHDQLLTTSQAALLQIVTFVPCLLYITFEASGTHSMVVLTFLSLLPEGLTAWRSRGVPHVLAPAMRPAVRPPLARPAAIAARQGALGGPS